MDLFCTVKSATDNGDRVECSVFMLQNLRLEPGTQVDQHRETNGESVIVASWELVEQTNTTLILKRGELGAEAIDIADGFYAQLPVEVKPSKKDPMEYKITKNGPPPPEAVLVFAGKNWKLASPKKWVPTTGLDLGSCQKVGELTIHGKLYHVFKLNEGFAASQSASQPS
jgi:hypothetical protein